MHCKRCNGCSQHKEGLLDDECDKLCKRDDRMLNCENEQVNVKTECYFCEREHINNCEFILHTKTKHSLKEKFKYIFGVIILKLC